MNLTEIKNHVRESIPFSGPKIKRAKHVEANERMIEELYYSDWGIPKPYLKNTAPEGYVLCNGLISTIPKVNCHPEFVTAMSEISLLFGGDDNNIGIPIIQPGSSLVQIGTGQPHTFTLGESGGAERHTLSANESGIAEHEHSLILNGSGSASNGDTDRYSLINANISGGAPDGMIYMENAAHDNDDGHTEPMVNIDTWNIIDKATGYASKYYGSTGSNPISIAKTASNAHNNMPPYFAVNYILRYI